MNKPAAASPADRVWRDRNKRPYEKQFHSAPAYMVTENERIAWAVGYNAAFREMVVRPFIAALTGGAPKV